jgi:UDP-GlcNAc:undecaprenyl-phosphate GlcNAc-1-phosphate transferase
VVGAVVVFLTGLFDDIRWISPRVKFLGEVLGAGIAVGLGLQVRTFPLVGVGILLAGFYLVGGANALNLLDGMDGLAAGTAAIAAFFFAILASGQGNTPALVLAMAVLGTTLGFLPYNWGISNFEFRICNSAIPNPQSAIFMGDSGSLFLGFTLSSIGVLIADRPYDLVAFITPLIVISIPILDTALAILRRLIHVEGPFSGDRQHIYDLLAGAGLGNGRAVLVIYLTAFMLGILSLVMIRLQPLLVVFVATGVVMILCIAAIRLGAVRHPASRLPGG